MSFHANKSRLTLREWLFVLSVTVAGTIIYSTIIVLLLRHWVSEAVFDFLNIWVTVACVPVLIWLGRKYILAERSKGEFS